MTQILKQGDRGALVSLLQLGLTRAGQTPGAHDGIVGAQPAAAGRGLQAAPARAPRCAPWRTTRRAASSTGSTTAMTCRAAKRSQSNSPP